jgi:ATP-binding cassette subfamily B (MDR/TAP) protein 1
MSSGFSNFTTFSMFVQGFWFGAKLVREGKITPGDVLAVFWACLIAASTMQNLTIAFVAFTRGKASMVTLMTLVNPPPSNTTTTTTGNNTTNLNPHPDVDANRMSLQPIVAQPRPYSLFRTSKSAPKSYLKPTPLRKIRPSTCAGEFQLTNITFSYPSRPGVPVLRNVSMFLPARETTFVVGGSGSGKSTLAQLLLRLYEVQHGKGTLELDGQNMGYLDTEWVRGEIGCVSQQVVMFDGTVHDNVALGVAGGRKGPGSRHPREVTREEVIAACRMALLHDFVKELPEGYDTRLGNGGASLSGGQKQRLAIARAYMRNPTVLILGTYSSPTLISILLIPISLDEATSALDGTSRLLVFEAIKHWRRNKTTIVITHDLSQITPDDFLYLLKDGSLVEQGFRADLEADPNGEFTRISTSQNLTGGFVPQNLEEVEATREKDEWVEEAERDREERNKIERKHFSALPANGWLAGDANVAAGSRGPSRIGHSRGPSRLGGGSELDHGHPHPYPYPYAHTHGAAIPFDYASQPRRRSLIVEIPDATTIAQRREQAWRRSSLQLTPTTATGSFADLDEDEDEEQGVIEDDAEFEDEKNAMQMTAVDAQRRRVKSTRRRWDVAPTAENGGVAPGRKAPRRLKSPRSKLNMGKKPTRGYTTENTTPAYVDKIEVASPTAENKPLLGFWALVRIYWPTIPNKFVYILGLVFSVLSGICTPIFGFFLAQLIIAITATAQAGTYSEATVTKYGLLVLGLAIGNGLAYGIKYWLIEYAGNAWLRSVRERGFSRIVMQDKKWFDMPNNVPSQLLLLLMRDPDDGKAFLTIVMPQLIVVSSMLGTGIIWALVRGWQLTLVAFGLIPVFIGLSTLQNKFSGQYESRNKERREDVNRKYYDAVANVRAIRAMGFERVFKEQFERALERAMRSGVDGGFVDGMAFGIANAIIYLAQGSFCGVI